MYVYNMHCELCLHITIPPYYYSAFGTRRMSLMKELGESDESRRSFWNFINAACAEFLVDLGANVSYLTLSDFP